MKTVTQDFYCDFVLSGKVRVKIVKDTANVLAFFYTKPSWKFHVVIIPKQHINTLSELKDLKIIQEIFAVAQEIVKEKKLDKSNFRIIINRFAA